MKKIVIFILVNIVAFNLFLGNAFASCVARSFQEKKDGADIIAIGIIHNAYTDTPYTPSKFVVEKYYKGNGPASITVFGGTGKTTVDIGFQNGRKYLLFLDGRPGEILNTNSCMGNRELENGLTQEENSILGQGYPSQATSTSVGTPNLIALAVILIILLIATPFLSNKIRMLTLKRG